MANKPLQTIKFPGLTDTYTVPQVDSNFVGTAGQVPDSKKVHDEIDSLKEDLTSIKDFIITGNNSIQITKNALTQGNWNSRTIVADNRRVCTKALYSVSKGDVIGFYNNTSDLYYAYGIYEGENTATSEYSGWITGENVEKTLEHDGFLFVQIANGKNYDASTYITVDVFDFDISIKLSNFVDGRINKIKTDTRNQLESFNKRNNRLFKNISNLLSNCLYVSPQSDVLSKIKEDLLWVDAVIPDGYTRLKYLKSTGTQYIITGYKPKASTKFELIFSFNETNDNQNNGMGSLGGTNCRCVMGIGVNQQWYWGIGAYNIAHETADTSIHTMYIDLPNGQYGIDSNNYEIEPNFTPYSQNVTAYLFGRSYYNDEAQNTCKENIYCAAFYENGKLVHRYIPCLDSTGVPCLYDEIEEATLYNKGTGDFEYEIYVE